MYFITRIARADYRSLDVVWVRDTKDNVEEELTKAQLESCVDAGIEIAGVVEGNELIYSEPKPVVTNQKMKLLKDISIVISADSSEVQYLRIGKGASVRVSKLPRLGDYCLYGGGGTLIVDDVDKFNKGCLANLLNDFDEGDDIISDEFNGSRNRAVNCYGINILLDTDSREEAIKFAEYFRPDHIVGYGLEDFITLDATTVRAKCIIQIFKALYLYTDWDAHQELPDLALEGLEKITQGDKAAMQEAIEIFDKYVIRIFKEVGVDGSKPDLRVDKNYIEKFTDLLIEYFESGPTDMIADFKTEFGNFAYRVSSGIPISTDDVNRLEYEIRCVMNDITGSAAMSEFIMFFNCFAYGSKDEDLRKFLVAIFRCYYRKTRGARK